MELGIYVTGVVIMFFVELVTLRNNYQECVQMFGRDNVNITQRAIAQMLLNSILWPGYLLYLILRKLVTI